MPRSNPEYFIHNPDGSVSSELSITIEDERINGGKPTNIPSIYKGKAVSDEEAIEIIARNGGKDPETGRQLPGYNSIEEAVRAAKERTNQLGKLRNGGDWFTHNAPESQPRPEERSLSGFAGNVVDSAGRFAADTAGAVAGLSPVGFDEESPVGVGLRVPPTLKAAGGLIAGTAAKAIPGRQQVEEYPEALGQALMDRYGSMDAIKRTAYEDPVGFLADGASLVSGVGGAARLGVNAAVKAGRTASTLGKVAETASKVGAAIDPVQAPLKAAGAATRAVAKTIDPYKIYQSALKPVGKPEEAARAVRAGVDEGIPISMKGVSKNQGLIEDLNRQIDSVIEQSQVTLKRKQQPKALPKGPIQMGPSGSVEAPQTVLSSPTFEDRTGFGRFTQKPSSPERVREHFLPADEVEDVESRIRNVYQGTSREPEKIAGQLDEAKNAQLIEEINRNAEESGLLDQIRKQAREAGEPEPAKLSDYYDIEISNTVDTAKAVRHLGELKQRFLSVNPESDLALIDAARKEFQQFYGKKIPAKLAQEIKKNTYRKHNRAYLGELKGSTVEAEKTIARGLKEELAKAFPELTDLNARESNLLALDDVFQKALKRIDNRDVLQLGTMLASAGGAATGGYVGAAMAALLRATIENPNFKSRMAIAIKNAQSRRGSGRISGKITPAARIEAYRQELEGRMNSGEVEAEDDDAY